MSKLVIKNLLTIIILALIISAQVSAESHSFTFSIGASRHDTMIDEQNPTDTNYADDNMDLFAQSGNTNKHWALIYFEGLADSLALASSVDTVELWLDLRTTPSAGATFRVCRGIDDEEWFSNGEASWYYLNTTTTTNWAAGQGDHSSSYTVTNQASGLGADTVTGTPYSRLVVDQGMTDLVTDIKTAGTDNGIWLITFEATTVPLRQSDRFDAPGSKLYVEWTQGEGGKGTIMRTVIQ